MSILDNGVEEARLALSPKQQTFVEAYFDTGSRTEAAITAYDCANRNSARVMAHRLLHNPKVLRYLDCLGVEGGLAQVVMDTLMECLHAEKTVKVNKRLIKEPDHGARLKAANQVFRILGVY